MLADVVRSQTHQPAVIAGEEVMTFGDLWTASGQVADLLVGHNTAHEDAVGLFLEPGPHLLAATWGTLRAGATYLPLATDYPSDRVRYMIRDAGIRTVITSTSLRPQLDTLLPASVEVCQLDTAGPITSTMSTPSHTESGRGAMLTATDGPDCLESGAYIIYTSGSTGRPKGVKISHAGIANQLRWLADDMDLRPGARILLKTPTSFDAAQWELLANATGASVVVGPSGIHRDPAEICELVREHAVTLLQCVPTLWSALVADPSFRRCSTLRHLFSGGEVLTAALANALHEAHPEAKLTNLYGPTEATINATAHTISAVDLEREGAIPIGVPVTGCWTVLLDGALRPVPAGETGELCIGGTQLGRV